MQASGDPIDPKERMPEKSLGTDGRIAMRTSFRSLDRRSSRRRKNPRSSGPAASLSSFVRSTSSRRRKNRSLLRTRRLALCFVRSTAGPRVND